MIKTNREEYDFIISLGGNCNVSSQLKHRGLRVCSFPLDWTLMSDLRPIKYLPLGIRTRFSNFAKRENMRVFEPPANEYGAIRQRLEDSVSGFRFIHQFSSSPEDEAGFFAERSIIQRRIDRFYRKVGSSRNILFVLGTAFSFDSKLLEDIYVALQEVFSGVSIELVSIQFSADTSRMFDLMNSRIHVEQCERKCNIVYDNQLTAPEWCWMDQINLAGRLTPKEIRKRNLFIKLKYKLWMWLGRSLENAGAGCTNMRFYKFGRYN